MMRVPTFALLSVLVALLPTMAAYSQDLSQSSRTPGAGGAALGAEIGDAVRRFGEAAMPPIQQAQDVIQEDTFGQSTQIFGTVDEAGGRSRGTQSSRRGAGSRRPTQPGQRRGSGRGLNVPMTLTLGFAYQPKVRPNVRSELKTCLGRLPNFGKTSSVRVRVEKKVVILAGTVATTRDRALAMQMVALQPGVYKIDNRLKVVGATNQPGMK